jgi:hypothetical protein
MCKVSLTIIMAPETVVVVAEQPTQLMQPHMDIDASRLKVEILAQLQLWFAKHLLQDT